jgi:hypothetical protein
MGASVFAAKIALRELCMVDCVFLQILSNFCTEFNHVKFFMNFANIFHNINEL